MYARLMRTFHVLIYRQAAPARRVAGVTSCTDNQRVSAPTLVAKLSSLVLLPAEARRDDTRTVRPFSASPGNRSC